MKSKESKIHCYNQYLNPDSDGVTEIKESVYKVVSLKHAINKNVESQF